MRGVEAYDAIVLLRISHFPLVRYGTAEECDVIVLPYYLFIFGYIWHRFDDSASPYSYFLWSQVYLGNPPG